jgi:AcrR family transcriptional regulator
MQRPTRRQKKPGGFHEPDLPNRLLDLVRAALERDGAAGLSLRAVAKSAGVFPTAVSHRFGDREGLLAAAVAGGFASLNAELEKLDGAIGPMLRAYVAFAERHPRTFLAMFSPWSLFERRHADVERAGQQAYALLRAAVSAAVGDARASTVADALWCTAHGLAVLRVEEGAGNRRGRLDVDAILQSVLAGLHGPA